MTVRGAMRVAVTGAAGKTGLAVAEAVRSRGHQAIPLVRNRYGLDGERVADLSDAAAMSEALSDADAVYLIAPNAHPDELGLLRPTLQICERAGIRVVYHSVMHAYSPRMPHHLDKARVEDALRRSTLSWTILQPASYMDNVLAPISSATDGVWHQPYDVTTAFTPIALSDLAEAAAIVLSEPQHSSATYELAGPQRLSSEQQCAAVRELLDRPLEVVADRDGWEAGPGALLPIDARQRLGLMFDYYDAYGFSGNSHVLSWLLGRQPLTFAEWTRQRATELAR